MPARKRGSALKKKRINTGRGVFSTRLNPWALEILRVATPMLILLPAVLVFAHAKPEGRHRLLSTFTGARHLHSTRLGAL